MNIDRIPSIAGLKQLIFNELNLEITMLYVVEYEENRDVTYSIENDNDFRILKQNHRGNEGGRINFLFKYVEHYDFRVLNVEGLTEVSSLYIGDSLSHKWVIKVNCDVKVEGLKCVFGEFMGDIIGGLYESNRVYCFIISKKIAGTPGVSYSKWRVFTADMRFFGPVLWIQFNKVIKNN